MLPFSRCDAVDSRMLWVSVSLVMVGSSWEQHRAAPTAHSPDDQPRSGQHPLDQRARLTRGVFALVAAEVERVVHWLSGTKRL